MWGRGLKRDVVPDVADAGKSPPMWGRGLKLNHVVGVDASGKSPPMWGRGLKLSMNVVAWLIVGRPPCGGVD